MALRGPGILPIFYGDASDGDLFVTGTFTLPRDMYFHTVWMTSSNNQTPTIKTNSYRLHIQNRIYFITSGTIDNSGGGGLIGGTGGTGSLSNSLQAGGNGGSGSTGFGQPGFPPPTFSASLGGSGGAGGTGTQAGGGAGTATPFLPSSGSVRHFLAALLGYTFGANGPYAVAGGGGGGGGGGPGAVQIGGGGGAGGGVIMLAAREIISQIPSGSILLLPSGSNVWSTGMFVNPLQSALTASGLPFTISVTGTIQANGGPGAAGQAGSVTGGGGGGGGGVILALTSNTSGSLVFQCLGGTGSAGSGGGAAGSNGQTGSVIQMNL